MPSSPAPPVSTRLPGFLALVATTTTLLGPSAAAERGLPGRAEVGREYLEQRWAGSDLAAIAAALEAFRADHGHWPASSPLRQLSPLYLAPAPKADPWGQAYRIRTGGDGGTVSSAGPDRRFGTADDLDRDFGSGSGSGSGSLSGGSAPEEPAPPGGIAGAPSPEEGAEVEPALPPAEPGPRARRTYTRMLNLASALESFREQRGHYPVGSDLTDLESALVPEHLSSESFRATDGWGHPFRYRGNDVGSAYTLVAAGSDGLFETLVPLRSGTVRDPARDLVLVDGAFVRWPEGVRQRTRGLGGAAPTTPAPAEPLRRDSRASPPPGRPTARPTAEILRPQARVEPGRAATTRARLILFAEALAAFRDREGHFPELDDATRIVPVLGLGVPAEDGWGNRLGYLSLAAGNRCVIASPGADGRFDRSLEDYLRGAGPSGGGGSDLISVNGGPVH